MLNEQTDGRTISHILNNSLTKKSKFILMNRKCYTHFCEWASLWYGKKCCPDKFNEIPIVLDVNGSTYLKVVDSASEEFSK